MKMSKTFIRAMQYFDMFCDSRAKFGESFIYARVSEKACHANVSTKRIKIFMNL